MKRCRTLAASNERKDSECRGRRRLEEVAWLLHEQEANSFWVASVFWFSRADTLLVA